MTNERGDDAKRTQPARATADGPHAAPADAPPAGERRAGDDNLLAVLPGLVRLAGAAWLRTTEWTVGASVRASSRLVRAAASGEPPSEVLREAGAEVREYVRRLLGLIDPDAYPVDGDDPAAMSREKRRNAAASDATTGSLRERGAELLRRSADVHFEEDAHPAYDRILSQLAPDEGRVLRLLALEGPQPAVDVRTGGPLNVLSSELVAPGLSMIGAEAGCRYLDRVPAYLNNLYRLGLIWFSREPMKDPLRYQVLEAQPDVAEAMRKAGRARTVRRSIHLTPFGLDFCETCLPLHTAELDALPGDAGAPGSQPVAPAEPPEERSHDAPADGPPVP
jgi:hypothetical protein